MEKIKNKQNEEKKAIRTVLINSFSLKEKRLVQIQKEIDELRKKLEIAGD